MSLAEKVAHVGTIQREHMANKAKLDLGPEGGEFTDAILDAPVVDGDFSRIFRIFQLDPDEFEIADETVRMSTWQTSRRTESGDRDVAQLYSYSARFRRVTKEMIPAATINAWRSTLIKDRPKAARLAPVASSGAYVVLIADPQLGKKGTEEAVENWRNGVRGHVKSITDLISTGRPPASIHIAWMGDETEGVANNYGNQAHTIELNQSRQLELDYDLRVWTIRQFQVLNLPISASSVISNHGEWTRNGSKDVVTTQGDNASTHIARQVQKLFDALEPHTGQHVEWHIGGGDPGVLINLAGLDCYFSHGYIEKGKGGSTEIRTKSAIERQILGRTDTLGNVPLWFMAHYHHAYSNEFEGRALFGCPALEAERSSEYMLNQYGVWSPPGMLGLLVGTHNRRGWSDLSIA